MQDGDEIYYFPLIRQGYHNKLPDLELVWDWLEQDNISTTEWMNEGTNEWID